MTNTWKTGSTGTWTILGDVGDLDEVQDWPISRYVGKFPNGTWEFIETVTGTKRAAYRRAATLQAGDQENPYCLWDQR